MLLELENLTVRFGGLTAVDGVRAAVESGTITAVIGPNGAGKTTVFNAVTGIYEPTSGAIRFAGQELRRPWRLSVTLACGAIGLFTGLMTMLALVNVDLLWRSAIKNNFNVETKAFSYTEAAKSAWRHFRGDLTIEPRGRRWQVKDAEARLNLAVVSSREAALAKRAELQAELFTSDDSRLQSAAASTRGRRHWALGGFLGGTLLGTAGALAVWSRSRRTPEVIALAGIARTFQNIRLFKEMTVLENVLTAMDRRYRAGVLRMALRTPGAREEEREAETQAAALLEFMGLRERAGDLARNLPYGDQRRLEIARALATDPQLILLDEPAAGMNPSESADLTQLIERIRQRGQTVLLIEHHMQLVMNISDRIVVLDYGKKIAEGTPAEIRSNPVVIQAYLGEEEIT